MVRIDASRVKPGVANFFALQDAGRTVRFFVVRDERGAVRAALDACTTCWKAGKGYAFDVNAMMCLTCKRRFTFSRIGMFKEGCNPYPLTIQQTLEKVVLSAHELLSGSRYFPDTP